MAEPLRITVAGLWHLGCVTAACCARHFQVTGVDFDEPLVAGLQEGRAPILEPGLNDLIAAGIAAKRLRFTTDPAAACATADVLWVCYDTPVNDDDESDVTFVLQQIRRCLPHLAGGALVLVSSQLPVGTVRGLEAEFPQFEFACSPENLRLGKALDAFEKAERVIVGVRRDTKKALIERLFAPFTARVQFMGVESAEMLKHALNSFLALSITFINEIARLCEQAGADAREVAAGLKSEPRIGNKAYLGPGGPFAGGTLARDVVTLTRLGAARGESLSLIPAIKESNDLHRGWALGKLRALGDLKESTVAVLGLTYTPNTDTLRRSAAIELCRALLTEGADVKAYDPVIRQLPADLSKVQLMTDLASALNGADAAVVCTEWPEFRQANWPGLVPSMRGAVIIDPNGFLSQQLQNAWEATHVRVGAPDSHTRPS
ncbi:MAG: UDPglucose 6-dehydrogenase [Verrucomicrobiota bacterium]|jgi:UDPglucose 6-dehydrogenase